MSPGIELTCCHFYHILLAKAGHRTTASSQGAGTYSASMARLRNSEQEGAASNEGEAWNENVPAFHGWPAEQMLGRTFYTTENFCGPERENDCFLAPEARPATPGHLTSKLHGLHTSLDLCHPSWMPQVLGFLLASPSDLET